MSTASPPEQLVAGKYRLTNLLGRGGMGSVWEGVHTTLGTRVAVKFIENEFSDSAEARSRFVNEAIASAKLASNSKYVVKVHDHGVTGDGRPYIVMEYLSGEPLEQRLQRQGRLSLAETATILTQVCRALTKAHEAGIVHRDLKPENVFLVHDEEDGTEIVKVVDFGIAKFTEQSAITSATRTGAVLGTPYYMSPEQARGLRSIDTRSDLWSIGVLAYRCLTGELPFSGEAVGDLLVQICTAPAPKASKLLPGLPPAFDVWLAKALAKEPAQRFQTAAETGLQLGVIAGIRAPVPMSMQARTIASDGSGSHPSLPRPIEGVTAAPFTQNAILARRKKPAPIAILAGVAAGATLFLTLGIAVIVKATRPSAASEVPTAAGEILGAPPVTAPPPSAEPDVVPTVTPPAASSAEAEQPPPKSETKTGTRTIRTTTTKTGTKSGTKSGTTGTKTGTKPGPDIGY